MIFWFARLCAATGFVVAIWALPAAAQSGTVAVTGDGTGTLLNPPVTGGKTTDAKSVGKKGKKKSAPAAHDTETASRELSDEPLSGEHAIVALVNDEPVTGFEVDRRAMMLSGSTVQAAAKANFEAIVKNPKTSQRLKAILNETVQGQPGEIARRNHRHFREAEKRIRHGPAAPGLRKRRASRHCPRMHKQALEELIDEKLKLQEAKKQNVTDRRRRGHARSHRHRSAQQDDDDGIHETGRRQYRSDEDPNSRRRSPGMKSSDAASDL